MQNFGMRMQLTCLISMLYFLNGENRGWSAPVQDWELIEVRDEISIYKKEVAGSDIVAFKGDGLVEAPLWKIASLFLDNERAPTWVDSLAESKIIRFIRPTEYIEYNHVNTPVVLKDRDFVSKVNILYEKESKTLTLNYRSCEEDQAPKTSYIRGEVHSSAIVLMEQNDGRRTRVIADIHVDPNGDVPKWIVNFFQKNWAYETFVALRKQAAKPDIRIPASFEAFLVPLRANRGVATSVDGHKNSHI